MGWWGGSWIRVEAVVAFAAGCSRPNPVVCCSSPADCNSLGTLETSRPCAAPYVCIDHECASAPADAAGPGPACTVDGDCPVTALHCAATGTCVACEDSTQCGADKPVRDQGTNTCRGCTSDGTAGTIGLWTKVGSAGDLIQRYQGAECYEVWSGKAERLP